MEISWKTKKIIYMKVSKQWLKNEPKWLTEHSSLPQKLKRGSSSTIQNLNFKIDEIIGLLVFKELAFLATIFQRVNFKVTHPKKHSMSCCVFVCV